MSLLRERYAFPVAPGGLEQDGDQHSFRRPGQVRQPDLKQAPGVIGPTGFGTGAGGGITNEGSDADQSQGIIYILVGVNPSNSGTCGIRFPVAPQAGQYALYADWATLAPTVSVNNLLIGWTGTRPLIPGEVLKIAYGWANSQ